MTSRRLTEDSPFGRHCSQRGTIPWNLLQSHLRDAGRRRSQSVPCQWHKTLRSFWGKFLAAGHCWLPWATRTGSWGRCPLQEPGNRKRHIVGAQCRRPCTLQDSGEISPQPTSIIIEQAKKNLRNSKYLDLRRTKMLMTCTILYYMYVLQIFLPGCGLPFHFLISVFWKASIFNLIRLKCISFFFCHSWIFLF